MTDRIQGGGFRPAPVYGKSERVKPTEVDGARPTVQARLDSHGDISIRTGARVTRARGMDVDLKRVFTEVSLPFRGPEYKTERSLRHAEYRLDRRVDRMVEDLANKGDKLSDKALLKHVEGIVREAAHVTELAGQAGEVSGPKAMRDRVQTNLEEAMLALEKLAPDKVYALKERLGGLTDQQVEAMVKDTVGDLSGTDRARWGLRPGQPVDPPTAKMDAAKLLLIHVRDAVEGVVEDYSPKDYTVRPPTRQEGGPRVYEKTGLSLSGSEMVDWLSRNFPDEDERGSPDFARSVENMVHDYAQARRMPVEEAAGKLKAALQQELRKDDPLRGPLLLQLQDLADPIARDDAGLRLPGNEHWLGNVELAQGRDIGEIRNARASGFVGIKAQDGASVHVKAVDKPIDRMVDRDGLIRMLGHPPKPDRKLLGLISIEGSPRYAKALRKIDAFHQVMREPVPSDPQARRAKLGQLHGLLKEARSALVAYSQHHPQNAALRATVNAVINRMNEEVGLLSSVNSEENQEFLQRHAVDGRPFSWASAASLMAGAGEAAMLDYDDRRIDRARSRDGLGSGINGTVDLVAYDDGSQWIFKPDRLVNPMAGGTAERMGIELGSPRQGDRIIATAIVDRLLSPPPKEGDPEPEPRETRRAIHNGQVGVLVPLAKGHAPMETRPGAIITDPGQIAGYDGMEVDDLQQMKVRCHRNVDVALSVAVRPENLPEDAHELDDYELGARYALARDQVWRDAEGVEVPQGDLRARGIDPDDEESLAANGIKKGIEYRTEPRPILDQRSRELAERFGAPIEHRDVAYQRTEGLTHRVDTHDPDLRRLLNIQECKDFVTGNHDRHPGNYKLEMGEDGRLARLNAYDDDETFPETFDRDVPDKGYIARNPDGSIQRGRDGEPKRQRAGHEVGLPVVMDREFAKHLLTLTWDDFRALDSTIPDKAVGVAKARFELLQAHARTLGEEGRLLDRDADGVNQWRDGSWEGPNGEDLHTLLSDSRTSYMGKLFDATRLGTVDMPGLAPRMEE